jgi:hypothetical protein
MRDADGYIEKIVRRDVTSPASSYVAGVTLALDGGMSGH